MKKVQIDINTLATTFIGSVLLMASCFEDKYASKVQKEKLYWKYMKASKDPSKYFKSVEDTWNINKILQAFEIKRTHEWPVCLVTSEYNCLLCPYVIDEDNVIPLSPRSDGFPVYTIRHAKSIQVINWNEAA